MPHLPRRGAGLAPAWDEAEAELRLAHDELLPHKPGGAAEASYGVGEVLRRRGDLAAAEQAFWPPGTGWDPQPGLALLRLAQGRVAAAEAGLRPLLASPPLVDRFAQARLLAAQVEVSIASRRSARPARRLGSWPPSSRPCPAR